MMNRTELQQVMINLIGNAIHAMPNGGGVQIRASSVEGVGTSFVVWVLGADTA